MNNGNILAAFLGAATVALVVAGTVWPAPSAAAFAGAETVLASSSTAEGAVRNLGGEIRAKNWGKAYAGLANKAQFTETEFVHDLTGDYPSLLTYSTLDKFEVRPLHASASEAQIQLTLHWATVVGSSVSTRELHVVKIGL